MVAISLAFDRLFFDSDRTVE